MFLLTLSGIAFFAQAADESVAERLGTESASIPATSGGGAASDAEVRAWLKQVEELWTSNFISSEDIADKYTRLYDEGNLVAGLYAEENSSGEQKKRWADINAANDVAALVRRAADDGDAIAQAVMGDIHFDPLAKFARDRSEATKWYRKSADRNNVSGMVFFADALREEKKYEDAVRWYGKAAAKGSARAQDALGNRYYAGEGVKQDLAEAANWYRQAAEQGYAIAQNHLGDLYYYGKGVKQDYGEAVNWYRQAAEQGLAAAQNSLGLRYYSGEGVKQDRAEAANWFRKAAKQGYAVAQYNLGNLYSAGEGVKQDRAEAVNWYRQAAEQGYASAQNRLGDLHYVGEDVKQDYAEAVNWYRKAAEQGHAKAKEYLAKAKERQAMIANLPATRRAAERGDADAQNALGEMYSAGVGVKQDHAEAENWYRKAAEQGHAKAKEHLAEIAKTKEYLTTMYRSFLGLPKAKEQAKADGARPEKAEKGGGKEAGAGLPKTYSNSVYMEFVLIPAGSFTMGEDKHFRFEVISKAPPHRVTISKPFYLGKYEVTQEQWMAVMRDRSRSRFEGRNNPVENVSWDDVQEFIRRLNSKERTDKYRLPTEAEWEYAARAGTTSAYSFGDDEGSLGRYAWYRRNSGEKTHPVGQKQPNPWGLYDMHGNVWEWVQDWYTLSYYADSPDTDPKGPSTGANRMLRGGSWNDIENYLRSAARKTNSPRARDDTYGFRLAISPDHP
jgi:TPR repeat protein